MFSFARTVADFIKAASGLIDRPRGGDKLDSPGVENEKEVVKKRKSLCTPIARLPHTLIGNVLQSYKQSLIAARSVETTVVATTLFEEDFVFSLSKYCAVFKLRNGQEVLIRPILPSDIEEMREILIRGEISQESLSLRFNTVTTTVKENYDTHFAVAACIKEGGKWKGVATARFIEDKENPEIAEWAAIVLDKYHGLGIGSSMLYYISYMASQFEIRKLSAVVHESNYPVLHWMKKLGAWQESYQSSRYWFYSVPIPQNWVFSEEARKVLEAAASGTNNVDSECIEELRQSARKFNKDVYLHDDRAKEAERQTETAVKKERRVPVVTFVKSYDDKFDIGDL